MDLAAACKVCCEKCGMKCCDGCHRLAKSDVDVEEPLGPKKEKSQAKKKKRENEKELPVPAL